MDIDERLPELLALIEGRPSPEDQRWFTVESGLGLELPAAYKNMVDHFGGSTWCDFLHVLSPFTENQHLNLKQRGRTILEADLIGRQSFPAHFPLPLYPEAGGLLPWAVTDNGDTLYWITAGNPTTGLLSSKVHGLPSLR
jgi:hypothetical protein